MAGAPARQTSSLDGQLCFALYTAANAVVRAYRPLLEKAGLTYAQYLVMLVLWHDGPQRIGDLAVRTNMLPHAMSPLVDRLESSDLVRRRRHPTDRRIVDIELTRSGKALETAVASIQAEVARRTGLSSTEVIRIRDDLQLLADRMSDSDNEPS